MALLIRHTGEGGQPGPWAQLPTRRPTSGALELRRDRGQGKEIGQAPPPAWDPGDSQPGGEGFLERLPVPAPRGPAVRQGTVAGI